MLKMLLSVPVIMVCATSGTIGLIKLIQAFAPKDLTGRGDKDAEGDK